MVEEASDKFDRFIEDFDQTLQKDTSTLKTISTPIVRSTTPEGIMDPAKVSSPILSTPTKSLKDPIPLESQPLGAGNFPSQIDTHRRSMSNSSKVSNGERVLNITPRTNGRIQERGSSSLRRSNTMSSVRSGPKKGLNLNISINKQGPLSTSRVKSPETPSISNAVEPMSNLSLGGDAARNRRRTNSSLSTRSSMTTDGADELNDSLRALALKEMKIIELKDELKLLQARIDKEEEELEQLKHKVGHNFREISPSHQRQQRVSSDSNDYKSPSKEPPPAQRKANRDSVWSKPISFLNQFDQILQNEIEKLNREAFPNLHSQSQLSRVGTQRPPDFNGLHPTSSQNSQPEEPIPQGPSPEEETQHEDMFNTVSNSLWSFVSDVKQGLLGEDAPQQTSSLRGKQRLPATKRQLQNMGQNQQDEQEMITYTKKDD